MTSNPFRLFWLALLMPAIAVQAGRGQPAGALPGEVTDSLRSSSDPSQMFAIYLPSAYSGERSWPVLFLMDPRGRARLPLDRFRPAAEKRGYILISSYNTMSDGPDEPNVRALNAMLTDIYNHFSVDRKRHYLGGFSGTARLAWLFAYQIPERVAGIIGFGAGVANGMVLAGKVRLEGKPFAFYGGSGYHDFNYLELIQLQENLGELDFPHKMVFYEGMHAWPARPDRYGDALNWMDLRAMKRELIPVDSAFVKQYYRDSLEEVGRLGDIYAEHRGLEDLFSSFEGMARPPAAVRDRRDRLANSRDLSRLERHISDLIQRYRSYNISANRGLERLLKEENPPLPSELSSELRLEVLQRQAADSGADPYTPRAARAMLELAYVKSSFYIPRDLLEAGMPERVPRSLEVALTIKPANVRTHLFHARAYSATGNFEQSLRHLEQLLDMGMTAEYLRGDTLLKAVTESPEFDALSGGRSGNRN